MSLFGLLGNMDFAVLACIGSLETRDAMNDRSRKGPENEEALLDFYGGSSLRHEGKVCVVTGKKGIGVNWAHLDEKRWRSENYNFVPLDSSINNLQQVWRVARATTHQARIFGVEIRSQALMAKAKSLFENGHPALAYGCARVGQTFAFKYMKEFDAVPSDVFAFLTQCFVYLSYKFDTDFMIFLLKDLQVVLDARDNIPSIFYDYLIQSVANLYQDLGDYAVAAELYEKVKAQQGSSFEQMGVTERRLGVGWLVDGSDYKKALFAFREAMDIFNNEDFIASGRIAVAWWHLRNDDPEEALNQVREYTNLVLTKEGRGQPPRYHPHNILEAFITQAVAKRKLGLLIDQERDAIINYLGKTKDTYLRPIFTQNIFSLFFISDPILNEILASLTRPIGGKQKRKKLAQELERTAVRLQGKPIVPWNGRSLFID